MANILDFLPMLLAQQAGRQELERTPEPDQVTAASDNVLQYDRVMTTKLVIAYAAGLQIIHQARSTVGGKAVDLACGPGHYTLCLGRYLGYDDIVGLDLSAGMVRTATQNAAQQQLDKKVRFQSGDITNLQDFANGSVDLASCTDAVHHLPTIELVARVMQEMDRITKPDGLVMVMDLARLRTQQLTERYVEVLGRDYVKEGLQNFLNDFRNSMFAAWTVEELRQAIPRNSKRHWCHLVPRGLPSTQIILGLPIGRHKPLLRGGSPWLPHQCPVPKQMHSEWRILSATLRLGSKTIIAPPANNDG